MKQSHICRIYGLLGAIVLDGWALSSREKDGITVLVDPRGQLGPLVDGLVGKTAHTIKL